MPRYGQIVLGPAGCGKSTYCGLVQENFAVKGRRCHVVNLDPATENELKYDESGDIRELIVAREVSEQLDLGPNGGLVAAMEYLIDPEGGLEWLDDLIQSFNEDDYIMFDLPGQIELYTSHIPIVRKLGEFLSRRDVRVAVVYCIDAMFITDINKFIAGSLAALATMVTVELPCVNLLTKADLVKGLISGDLDLHNDLAAVRAAASLDSTSNHARLQQVFIDLLEEYSLGKFAHVTATDEESVHNVVTFVNNVINFGDDLEPRDQDYLGAELAELADKSPDHDDDDDDDGGHF